uniref:Ovule protein n=1 Tax=Brugia timori TaxID=42155 RepID=A0A0R3R714_9BILA
LRHCCNVVLHVLNLIEVSRFVDFAPLTALTKCKEGSSSRDTCNHSTILLTFLQERCSILFLSP